MSDPYLGQILVVGFNFDPVGYEFCNGQLLSISQNDALYSLLGTTYGGDGVNTFGLPDLNGRLGVGSQGQGPGLSNYPPGQKTGTEGVTLTTNQLPSHGHTVAVPLQAATGGPASANPVGKLPGASASAKPYAGAPTSGATLNPRAVTAAVGAAGGNQAHSNIQPVLALNYIIATQGIYPNRN